MTENEKNKVQKLKESLEGLRAANAIAPSTELSKAIADLQLMIAELEPQVAEAPQETEAQRLAYGEEIVARLAQWEAERKAEQEQKERQKQAEQQAAVLYQQKGDLVNTLNAMKAEHKTLKAKLAEQRKQLAACPEPTKMRVWSLVIWGVIFFDAFSIVALALNGSENGILLAILSIVPYMIFVGALARACKRSAALTLFNLLTCGIFGAIFALVSFIRSFLIKPERLQDPVLKSQRKLMALEEEMERTEAMIADLDTQINVLKASS